MNRSTAAKGFAALALASALFAVACSSPSNVTGQDSCSVYVTDTQCSSKLACQCEKSVGCFCVSPCDPTADAGTSAACPSGSACAPGTRPDLGSTGFFCFATDGGK